MKLYILTESGKTELDLEPGQYTLGAAGDNSIQVEHPTVSTHHAVMDVSESGQVLIQSLIPSGMIDSDGGIQDMLTLFPGDICRIGKITIGRDASIPMPPPPPQIRPSTPQEQQALPDLTWTDIFHYPLRKDGWIMFLIMWVLTTIPLLIPSILMLPGAMLSLALGLLYAFTMLGTFKEIIRTTIAGDDDLEMPIADSFDWENSKDIFLGYFLLSIVWLSPAIALNWMSLEQVWARPLALAVGLSILPMALLMMVVHDNVLAGFHVPGIFKAVCRAPFVYAGILALLAVQVGVTTLIEATINPEHSGILLTRLVQIISNTFSIYAMFVTARALGLYARRYLTS